MCETAGRMRSSSSRSRISQYLQLDSLAHCVASLPQPPSPATTALPSSLAAVRCSRLLCMELTCTTAA
eukprot:3318620-Alexandrium_andersonii.AAC.1